MEVIRKGWLILVYITLFSFAANTLFALDPIGGPQPLPGPGSEPVPPNPNNGSTQCWEIDWKSTAMIKTEATYSKVPTADGSLRYKHDTVVTKSGVRLNAQTSNPCDTETYEDKTTSSGSHTPQFYDHKEQIGDACEAAGLSAPIKGKDPRGKSSSTYECSAKPPALTDSRCTTTEEKKYTYAQTATSADLRGIKWMLKHLLASKATVCIEHCVCAK